MKAFLKINRNDPASILCLRHWFEVFKTYETFILCDLYDTKKDPVPDFLKTVLVDYEVQVINSDYSLGSTYFKCMKGAKHGMASANMTCFQHLGKSKGFWIIDADDTMFLTRNYDLIREKLSLAEKYLFEKDLHGFSLDFYRNLNNCWTFGVCLLRADTPWQLIKDLSADEVSTTGLARNIDTAFQLLKNKGKLKLENFVFDRMAFQHSINNYPEMPHGIYCWHRGNLWDKPLQSDVVIL
jgi:hypothetical protein